MAEIARFAEMVRERWHGGSASANEVRDETVHLFTAGAVKRRCSQVRDTPVHLGGEEGRHARKHKHVPHLQRPGNRVT